MENLLKVVYKIEDPEDFFEKNQDTIYIFKTIGLREFENEDDIGKQIQNLDMNHKFNVNELIIFRTFYSHIILAYVPMNGELFCFLFTEPVLNSFIMIDNIILFYLKNGVQAVDIKNYKTKLYNLNNFSLEKIFYISENFMKEKIENKTPFELNDFTLCLKKQNINNYLNKQYNCNLFVDRKIKINCEKILSTFVIENDLCYCISVINETRQFKYVINLSGEEQKIFSLKEFIDFLIDTFYSPLKYKTLIYSGDDVFEF